MDSRPWEAAKTKQAKILRNKPRFQKEDMAVMFGTTYFIYQTVAAHLEQKQLKPIRNTT